MFESSGREPEAAKQRLLNKPQEIRENLIKWAKQNGILLNDLPETAVLLAERFNRNLERFRTTDTSKLAYDYRTRVMDLMRINEAIFGKFKGESDQVSDTIHTDTKQALEVINWHNTQISAAISRAYASLAQHTPETNPDETAPEYNGHAKLALTCIEESYPAWEILMREFPFIESDCWSLLVLLEKIRCRILADFPECKTFCRPGLDDLQAD